MLGAVTMTNSTSGNKTVAIRTLRIWSGIGAGILVAGVILLGIGVLLWHPLSTAPELWSGSIWVVLPLGLVVTVIATTTLAARSRQH